jgi:membrane-bound metal-dependent hydrolase YbcI (DUF457 family)
MGAHGLRRTVPLWLLVLASQAPDWADAVVCSSGLRPSVVGMYSHSIPATLVIALVASVTAQLLTRDPGAGVLTAAVVIAHTVGDYLTGIKPTWPGGPLIGARLYTQPALDFLIETALLGVCFLIYRRSFPAERRSDKRIYILPALLILIQAATDIVLALTPSIEKC